MHHGDYLRYIFCFSKFEFLRCVYCGQNGGGGCGRRNIADRVNPNFSSRHDLDVTNPRWSNPCHDKPPPISSKLQ
jgi:hypothetical protein